MSGFVGVFHLDRSPVDSALLHRLTDFLRFRGPDAQHFWINGNVGLGHTLFKTTEESERDCQPLTLDGRNWIVADVRIDAREDLFAALEAAGEPGIAQTDWTDAELILRAYRVWGVDCVEHLLGDFAFGIWDAACQQLLCARDHMGVKPFYYAQVGSSVIFSNTLDCIRRHPLVSDRLNDLAIADFLLFGSNQDTATTSFAEIRRLPPAHRAIWSRSGLHSGRYWSMPIDEPLFYKRPGDYIDQFHDLLRRSVADRLRTRQLWVFMSGGIDSPTLAAAARDLMQQRSATFDLRALTNVDSFVPAESHYAALAAKFLGIPIRYRCWTEDIDSGWEKIPFSTPEPTSHAWMVPAENKFWLEMGSYSRVFFYGEGPDNALHCDWKPYLSYLSGMRKYRQLLGSIIPTLLAEKRPLFWGRISKRFERGALSSQQAEPGYPGWLNASFEARLSLRARWASINSTPLSPHPYRPIAYMSLQIPLWQALFEGLDPGVTKRLCEVRHPFVDIRMLRFLLAVPALPWCRSKYLLRRAMRGHLPDHLLRRRKTTPALPSVCNYLTRLCQLPFPAAPRTREYINDRCFPHLPNAGDVESNIRARSLNHWLQNLHGNSDNFEERIPRDRFAQQAAGSA